MKTAGQVFEFHEYKAYLHAKTGPRTVRSGVKRAMAEALKCQPTYVSQVLYGSAHFSLEQGEHLSDYFGHTSEEKHYFLLLIQKARAGTKNLEQYFENQIAEIGAKRLVLTERLGSQNKLSREDQSVYYSSWHFAGIHMALTIPGLRTAEALAEFLRIPLKRVYEVLEFLCAIKLARRNGSRFENTGAQVRLGKASPNIIRHHSNWRNQAIESLERETLMDLHYSAAVTLSKSDALALKDQILDFIDDSVKRIRKSKEEELYCYCIDFFDLRRP